MAQTRAIGRALRAPLSPIAKLAGYEPASAEEMPTDIAPAAEREPGAIPAEHRPTREQEARIFELLTELEEAAPDTDWKAKARQLARMPYELLTRTTATALIEGLEAELDSREVTPSPE